MVTKGKEKVKKKAAPAAPVVPEAPEASQAEPKEKKLVAPKEKDCLKIEDLGDSIKYVTKAGQKIIIPKK